MCPRCNVDMQVEQARYSPERGEMVVRYVCHKCGKEQQETTKKKEAEHDGT